MSTSLSTITSTKLKCRYQETYVSEALNVHNAAHLAGVLFGFTISAPSARNIRFSRDSTLSLSLARIRTNDVVVTYRETSDVTIDLAAHGGTIIYIGLTVTYTTAAATTGAYVAYTEGEYAAGVDNTIWLCKVDVPAVGALTTAMIDTSSRSRCWDELRIAPDYHPWLPVIADPSLANGNVLGSEVGVTGDATSSLDAVEVDTGINSIHLELTGASAGNVYRLLRGIGVTSPSTKIRCSFKLKTVAATATEVGIYLRYRDEDYAYVSAELVGLAVTASTVDWTTYTYEVTAPVGVYFIEIGVGATALSAGDVYIEIPQVFTEYSNSFQRGMQGINLLTQQLVLAGEDTASVDLAQFYWSAANELRLLASGGDFHIGIDAAEVDVEIHGALVCDESEATSFAWDVTRTRYEVIDFTFTGSNRWRTTDSMTVSQDTIGLAVWPTLLGEFSNLFIDIPLQMLKKGETITEIEVGVDDTADGGSPTWDMEIREYSITDGSVSIVESVTGLTRSGAGNIRTVTWTNSYTRTVAGNAVVLTVELVPGLVAHHHYYIKLTITTPGVDESIGLE